MPSTTRTPTPEALLAACETERHPAYWTLRLWIPRGESRAVLGRVYAVDGPSEVGYVELRADGSVVGHGARRDAEYVIGYAARVAQRLASTARDLARYLAAQERERAYGARRAEIKAQLDSELGALKARFGGRGPAEMSADEIAEAKREIRAAQDRFELACRACAAEFGDRGYIEVPTAAEEAARG